MTQGTFQPVDAGARRRILESLDETLLVEAGAGTGKTHSLVGRAVELVASGRATMDRIAAITFTEAAAAELRDRIREGLERRAASREAGEEEGARCARGAADLDGTAVQTLHGFARALLGERPLDAGLPPSFEVLDDIRASLLFEEEWQEWLDTVLEDEELRRPLRIALSLGLTIGAMREVAWLFHDRYDLVRAVEFPDEPFPPAAAAQSLAAARLELEGLLVYARNGDADVLAGHVRDVCRVIDRVVEEAAGPAQGGWVLRQAQHERAGPAGSARVWRLLAGSPRLTIGRGRVQDWEDHPETGENVCTLLKRRLGELQAEVDEELVLARRAALTPLLRALRDFATDFARKRKAGGRAGYQDLLVWARDLLRDHIPVRDHFRSRFTHLLIDEFQDTDPIQAEIALFLAEDAPPGVPDAERPWDWRRVRPAPGKIFVVGDPKQSIYRFRHADIALVDRLREVMATDPLALVQNFRSDRPVIDWVNHVFARWMQRTEGQPAYADLHPRWDGGGSPIASSGVYRIGGPLPGKAADVMRREAQDVADLVRHIRDGGWPVSDRGEDGAVRFRPARYADICLLVPRRTGLLHDLETTLEDAGVPYRLESASLVFETQEVRDLLNCLEAVDNPADQVALVAALRSPAFACSDVDLLSYLDGGGRLDYLFSGRNAPEGPVLDALRALSDYHGRCRWTPFPLLIEEFVRGRRLLELALAHPRPREQWRRYQFVIDRARAFVEAGGLSLRSFLQWMRDQQEERARSVETPVPEGDEDAIRILTIHGAKGLEFPIVVMADLGGRPRAVSAPVLFHRQSGAVEVRLGRFETAGYAALREVETEREREEQVRLMYVAATRARDHLVVTCHRPEQSSSGAVSQTLEGFFSGDSGAAGNLWLPLEVPRPPGLEPSPPDGAGGIPGMDTPEARERWTAERAKLVWARSLPPSAAATTLRPQHLRRGPADRGGPAESRGLPEDAGSGLHNGGMSAGPLEQPGRLEDAGSGPAESPDRMEDWAGEAEPWRRGRAGTSAGRAVHAVLQTVDLATGEGLEPAARAQAQAEGIPGREADIVALASRAIESDIVRRALASGRWWREVPVGAPVGDGVLEGFIDLLFEEDGGLVVVDYKTDALSGDEEIDRAMDRYRLQGGAYALAIGRVTGRPVREVVFLFLQPRRQVRIEDLPRAMADAEAAATAYLCRPWSEAGRVSGAPMAAAEGATAYIPPAMA